MSSADLKELVSLNEFRIKMLMELVDPDDKPFAYHVLKGELSETQYMEIMDLMQSISEKIQEGRTPINHQEFEMRVYEIAPQHDGDHHYVEGIVSTLNEEGRFQTVYEHMKHSGMNI